MNGAGDDFLGQGQAGRSGKKRLDLLLVERGLFPSRERAQAAILAGRVWVDGVCITKAGAAVSADSEVVLRGEEPRYVSRGGFKLEKALRVFGIDPGGKVCLDIGASTGGFTDCLLQHGAQRVYAVDVGYGQFAWSLRNDPRVVLIERQNARHLTRGLIPEDVDLVVIDVSFISVTLILPALPSLLAPEADVVALVKPQFEAGRGKVGRKGVVRDPSVHCAVIRKVMREAEGVGFLPWGLTYSPIAGEEGNIEFLLALRWRQGQGLTFHFQELAEEDILRTVSTAHSELLAKRPPSELS